ncbi:PIN domain-containing protein [Bradyrhizobium sp. B117]|uniref:PIN domain-containing protein n=1 Tax=Bradyrhizobium sp. B117 TaxID=3140246 RepID=UPI003182D8DF
MKYDAVTLDTNIFKQKHLNLERGLLAQFKQFAEGSARFVLSEIVQKEVLRHLKEEADLAKKDLEVAIRRSGLSQLFDEGTLSSLRSLTQDGLDASAAADRNLKKWMESTACEIVRASGADIERLIAMYFAIETPFEEGKKHEFPDAIALITLEDWAKSNSKKLLAITRDKGWIAFCGRSEWIDTEQDVSSALQGFQAHTESARRLVASLLGAISAGGRQDFKSELDKRLAREIEEIEPEIEAYSDEFYWDVVDYAIEPKHISLIATNDSFKIIQTQKDGFVVQMTVEISARVRAEFYHYADAAHAHKVGASRESVMTEFRVNVLGSIRAEAPDDCTLAHLELDDPSVNVDFGDIFPEIEGCEE